MHTEPFTDASHAGWKGEYMKIGVILTGGTIGSHLAADGYLSLTENAAYTILQGAAERGFLDGVTVVSSEPLHVLSEQMTGDILARLVEHVRQRMQTEDCDGWILLHGSDTLAYTAAVLGYVLGTQQKPLVLVSSNAPLTDPTANGWTNFDYAVRFLRTQQATGVFVSHCNTDGVPTIHEGTRLLQQLPGSGNLESFCNAVYGIYDTDGKFVQQTTVAVRQPMLPPKKPFHLLQPAPLCCLCAAVGNGTVPIPEKAAAILYQCYHSGTVCTDSFFLTLVASAAEKGIPFYLTGCRSDAADYETKKALQHLPVQVLYDVAPIAAYCQLWIAVSNGLPIA
jgi:L-asparaginase